MNRKIILITTELSMGGAEKCAVDLAIRLKSHGYKAIVISIASKPVTELTLVERLEENAIETIYLNSDSIFSACNAFAKLSSSLICLLYTSPSPRDRQKSRMPSSA